MSPQFSETAPGGAVSGRKTVRRQAQGLLVEYDLESTAEEAVSVRLADRVPTERAEEFGFHEEHEPPEWTLSDGDLEMAVALDPGDERTVVFGLVAAGGDLAYDPGDPSIDVDVRDAGDAPDARDDGDAGDSPDDGGGFFDPARRSLDAEDEGGDADGGDSADEGQHPAGSDGWRPNVDADGGVVDSGNRPAGGVVSTLVDELEAGTVSESELATLRDHLAAERPGSEAARLEYVQKRLGEFDAYVDALEDLLSVHGSGEDALTELEGRLEGFAGDVEAIRRRQDELADRVDELAAAHEAHAETVESLQVAHEEDVAEISSELRRHGEAVSEEVEDLRRSVGGDLAALEAEIEAFESIRRRLVDGLRRPADATADTTVEDEDPDAVAETEEVPDTEPAESPGVEPVGEPEEAVEPVDPDDLEEPDDGARDPTAVSPDVDRDVEESLETAAASHFSVSGPSTDEDEGAATGGDDGHGTDTVADLSLEESGDDGGSPGGPDDGEQPDDEGSRDAGSQPDEVPDDGFVSPLRDDDGAAVGGASDDDATAAEETDVCDGSDDGDSSDGVEGEATDLEIPGLEAEADDDADAEGHDGEGADDRDDEQRADERDDDGGRASSIFEIGDVDSGGSSDDEVPTIDFEDH